MRGDHREESGVSVGHGTNQMAELLAVKQALLMIPDLPSARIVLHSDSKYAIGCLTGKWNVRVNRRLASEVRLLIKECASFKMIHVLGHNGNQLNETADRLASMAASGYPTETK